MIVDLEIQFIDPDTGKEKINGSYQKVGQNYTYPRTFEGTNYKKLLSKKLRLVDQNSIFFKSIFNKIKELDKLASNFLQKKLKLQVHNRS